MKNKEITALMHLKDLNTKLLVSGDKQTKVVLMSTTPKDVQKLADMQRSEVIEVSVTFKYVTDEQ